MCRKNIAYNEGGYQNRFLAFSERSPMNEAAYQAGLIKKIRELLPGCLILKNDSSYMPGIPDILILYNREWAMLEVKISMIRGVDLIKTIILTFWVLCRLPLSLILGMRRQFSMIFNTHSDLLGRHAFLSPSSYHWLNYSDQKLADRFAASTCCSKRK